jgi:hypothetical protein
MAKLDSHIQFTGALGNLSAYAVRGSDRIVLRTKGGPSRQQIKTSPSFEHARRNGAEFGGRSTASKWIMKMARPLKALADHNIAAPLNALLQPIQLLDTENEWGKRHVRISRNRSLLQGFSFNRKSGLDSVLRTSISFSLERATRTAGINIPELQPQINFFVPGAHHLYSIVAGLGILPDLFYNDGRYEPSSPAYAEFGFTMASTPWHPVADHAAPANLELNTAADPPDDLFSLILSVGIRYGTMKNNSVIEQVRHAGSAKILALA